MSNSIKKALQCSCYDLSPELGPHDNVGFWIGFNKAVEIIKEAYHKKITSERSYLNYYINFTYMKLSKLLEQMNDEVSICTDVLQLQKNKMGTKITIGAAGDLVGEIYSGEKIAMLLIIDKVKLDEAKKKLIY